MLRQRNCYNNDGAGGAKHHDAGNDNAGPDHDDSYDDDSRRHHDLHVGDDDYHLTPNRLSGAGPDPARVGFICAG